MILDDFADGWGCSSAHQLADGKHAEGGDKNEEGTGDDSWSGEWKNHVLKGFEGSGAEVEGGFDEEVLEFFDGAVDGKDEEGEIGIDQAEDNGAWGVEKLEGFDDEVGGLEEAVEEAVGAEDGHPCIGADEKARPKGNHHQGEE